MIKRLPLYRTHPSFFKKGKWHCYARGKFGHRVNLDISEYGDTPDEAREKTRRTFQRVMRDIQDEKIQRHW